MLQQTQVITVVPYFEKFMQRYPDVQLLADADLDEILHLWSGLGYYARARNLHRTAQIISNEYSGHFPTDIETLMTLPGIGRSTAGAVLSLSLNQPYPILEGNVKRVLARYHAISGWPGERPIAKKLWQIAEQHVPVNDAASYTQGIMDLGALICTRSNPLCEDCPVQSGCQARIQCLQGILPDKKARKKLPVRQTIFAMIENQDGEILLEKRPPAGIWGGLWSFPECDVGVDITVWVKNKFGHSIEVVQKEPGLRHTFSHYHLDIFPVRVKLGSMIDNIQEQGDWYWFKPEKKKKFLGMPKPVNILVENYFNPS